MILKIEKIKSFGVFDDFRWPADVPVFKQFNLIYGWNYSGKTTLSRVFRCFEQKRLHPDFLGAQVHLRSADGTVYDLSAPENVPEFRVFNTDFIRDNLKFEEGSAAPVLILGAEDIAKQEELKLKRAELEKTKLENANNEKTKNEKSSALSLSITTVASYIKTSFAIPLYNRTKFEPVIKGCQADPSEHTLSDEALADNLAIYQSTDKKAVLSEKSAQLSSVSELKADTESLLARVVTGNNPIPLLRDNPKLEQWVNDGRPLHEGKDRCQFCEQSLPSGLLAQLAGHFSAEYESLMDRLGELAKQIEKAKEEKIRMDHRADFYPEFSARFTAGQQKLEEFIRCRNGVLDILAKCVAEKKSKAFTSITCPPIDDPGENITSVVETINSIIDEHNARTAEFERKRQQAFTLIERHYAATFVLNEKYNETLQSIGALDSKITSQGQQIVKLTADIRSLEEEVSEESKGAERINELLSSYFGKNDLQIQVTGDKRFQISRGEIPAKNLSEGEKTAIAFAYFITRVHDGRPPLAETHVFIDDPISSLDANHLFNTYAMIKTQLDGCRQLFIATHSFEFYNLIREWASDEENTKKPQAQWNKWGIFYLSRTNDMRSSLVEIPIELLRFRSEYHYLFSKLYHFDNAVTGSGDFDCLLGLPNMVRRFMEAFGGIMIPLNCGLPGKIDRLFPDKLERERIWKFINHYSHNTTITRSLAVPDLSECQAVVQACLAAIKSWDGEYFKDMESAIS